MRTAEFFRFIDERWRIYKRRESGAPKPWTKDPILQQYRFCNIHRENDVVTKWIADNWRYPHRKDLDLWFAMTVARFLNKPTTLAVLGYPVPWSAKDFKALLKDAPRPLFSAAYMVRSDPGDKVVYLADKVLTPLWKNREDVRPRRDDRLAQFAARLSPYYGLGSFMIGQIVADTKFVEPLKSAVDWWTWAAPGPGSNRGMTRVLGLPLKRAKNGTSVRVHIPGRDDPSKARPEFQNVGVLSASEWARQLGLLQVAVDPLCRKAGIPRLSAQDIQNCLCEFDKYERARLGEGRPKQRYNGV